MLFSYKKIPHDLDKFHSYIEYLVLHVWCKANTRFSQKLLQPELLAIAKAMPVNYLLTPIRRIHNYLLIQSTPFKNLLSDGFKRNNNIEALCNNSETPFHYSEIKVIDKKFANDLYKFFVNAYSLLDDTRVVTALKGIDNHYDSFFEPTINPTVCPFCGILPMLNRENTKREAYDHFFPKETYPFNSVNFNNLVPMCHTCNSKYKTRKDPINVREGGPRKNIEFPYSTTFKSDINVEFTFANNDIVNLTSSEITVSINTTNPIDKINRWKEVFGIEERYKAICCDVAAYKGWLEEYKNLKGISSISYNDYKATKLGNPYLNKKFLEVGYLDACINAGVIS